MDIRAAKDNEKAQKVISLIKETVSTPVLNVLTPITRNKEQGTRRQGGAHKENKADCK